MDTIQLFIDQLPDNTTCINISNKGLIICPDLSRFKNLKSLNCSGNKLTSLYKLNDGLESLYCFVI